MSVPAGRASSTSQDHARIGLRDAPEVAPRREGKTMKTAIAVGGQVLAVEIHETETGHSASCSEVFRGEQRSYTATGDSYDNALQALRGAIFRGRSQADQAAAGRRQDGAS
jgi:hypothetical protein